MILLPLASSVVVVPNVLRALCNTGKKILTSWLPHQPDENAPERPPSAYVIFSNSKAVPTCMSCFQELTSEQKYAKS